MIWNRRWCFLLHADKWLYIYKHIWVPQRMSTLSIYSITYYKPVILLVSRVVLLAAQVKRTNKLGYNVALYITNIRCLYSFLFEYQIDDMKLTTIDLQYLQVPRTCLFDILVLWLLEQNRIYDRYFPFSVIPFFPLVSWQTVMSI